MWCFVTCVFNCILDPFRICIKRECMELQVAPLFHTCPGQESSGEWEQQQNGLKSCVTQWGCQQSGFLGQRSRVCPVLVSVPALTKTCFSSQEAREEFAPGNDRSSSWKRAQTGLEAEQKGQAFICVQWHLLV